MSSKIFTKGMSFAKPLNRYFKFNREIEGLVGLFMLEDMNSMEHHVVCQLEAQIQHRSGQTIDANIVPSSQCKSADTYKNTAEIWEFSFSIRLGFTCLWATSVVLRLNGCIILIAMLPYAHAPAVSTESVRGVP